MRVLNCGLSWIMKAENRMCVISRALMTVMHSRLEHAFYACICVCVCVYECV
jgi:hypothetical protein